MNTIENLNKDLLLKQFNEFKVESFDDLENVVNYFKIKIDAIKHPFLEREIDEIYLSRRTFNIIMYYLKEYNICDIRIERPKIKHIVQISLEEFKKLRGAGQYTISEIESILNRNGYSLSK